MAVPIILLLAAVLGLALFMTVMLPFSIVMRYRAGSAKRRAWGCASSLNFFAALFSAAILLVTSAVSQRWIPNAIYYTLLGLALGFALGLLGLLASRWETTPRGLHYTPNRWLVLIITIVVTTRILYGFWRSWHAWRTTPAGDSWLAESGAAGSMAAGATVLGYYIIYWLGVWRRVQRHLDTN